MCLPGRPLQRQAAIWIAFVMAMGLGFAGAGHAEGMWQAKLLGEVALADLPPEARETDRLIRQGGPFPYRKDGSVFGNRERILPKQPRGHYREYTVDTPSSRDRGARRIVCGGDRPKDPEKCFYTADHYASFKSIVR